MFNFTIRVNVAHFVRPFRDLLLYMDKPVNEFFLALWIVRYISRRQFDFHRWKSTMLEQLLACFRLWRQSFLQWFRTSFHIRNIFKCNSDNMIVHLSYIPYIFRGFVPKLIHLIILHVVLIFFNCCICVHCQDHSTPFVIYHAAK